MNYYIERVFQAIITFVVAASLSFFMYRLMPGGPIEATRAQLIQQELNRGGRIDMERINRVTEVYTGIDPNQPIHIAYIEYVQNIILQFDFGESLRYREGVFEILFEAMSWSIFVNVYGLLLGFSATILLGSLMAYWRGSKFDSGATVLVLVMSSIPYYVGAIVMLSVLAYQWGLFPTGGRFDPNTAPGFNLDFVISLVRHGALPIMTGFIIGFGGGAIGLRANAIRIIGENYLHSARMRGINIGRITSRYVARNAILPLYTGLMIGISGIFGGSVIMEWIFSYPGVGWYTFEALEYRDYPLLMGAFLFFTGITVVGILIADLSYGLVDPRAGSAANREEF